MSNLFKFKSAKVVLSLMIGLALLTSAGTASAALTTDQVNAILSLLNSFGADASTVANVQASLTGGTPASTGGTTSGSTLNFGPTTLRVGSTGQYVKNLQTLVGAGSDGNFGPATKAKVMAWQSANGLVADGVFGAASKAKAAGGSASTTTPAAPVSSGPVSVALASSNPAARSVVIGEAGADLAHFMFTGSGTVTNVTLKRVGVSADATLSNVYLYDGATRLTDSASVSSNSMITFNDPTGLFAVGGSKTISVRSDLAGSAGETVGVALVGFTSLGQSAVTLSSPMSGNIMTVATASLAAVDFATVTPAANGSLTPDKDIIVWQSTATVTVRDVWLTRFTAREVGSIAKTDLTNLRLIIGSTTVATASGPDANGYVTFAPTSPYKLITGAHTFKVVADVVGGSSLTFTFSIRNRTDIGLVDSQYNVGFLVTDTVAQLTGFQQTVSTGQVTVQKDTTSPTGTVVLSGTDVVLGRFSAKTYGERVKVDTMLVKSTTAADGGLATLRNGRILINGQQVGSTSTIAATASSTSFNINHIFMPGTTSIIEVRADVFNNRSSGTAFVAGDTVSVSLVTGVDNAQGLVSGDASLDVPSGVVAGSTLSIGTGSMTLAKDQAYGSQTVVVPTTGTLLGSWVLTSGTTEALNVDTIRVDMSAVVDAFDASADLSNVYVMYGSKSTSSKSTVSLTAGANTWNISETLPVNTSMTFKVYGDIASSATNGDGTPDTLTTSLKVSGTSASGTAVNTNGDAVLAGQVITASSSGVLTVSLDSNSPVSAQVVAGTTDPAGALKVKLSGTNEDQYVKTVKIMVNSSANSAKIASLGLAWSATSGGSYAAVGTDQTLTNDGTLPGFSTWSLTGAGRVTVPKNGSVYLKVTPTYVSSGQTEVSSSTNLPKLLLANLEAEGTSLLAASGTASGTLVNSTGLVIQANSSSSYVDSTETKTAATVTAVTTTLPTANGIAFAPGDIIFVDNDGGSDWDPATEELMVVLADGGVNLTVQRGSFGTTATAMDSGADKIYRLSGTVASFANASIIGNAMTVLETKLGVALKSDSPSGAFTGGTGKYLFGLTFTAANNSADSATNTATITYIDVTNNKSAATVANLTAYPAEYDNNSTYATTCSALSSTKWRCTMSTTGSTNQIDENSSRSYTFRGDLGYSGAGSVDFSLASLGTSDTSTNSVKWSDGAATPSSVVWVNQPTTVVQGGSLTTTAISGTADATPPTITAITITDATADNALTVGATVAITFSEMMDPATISATLVPGAAAVAVTDGATGDISGVTAASDLIRVKNIIDIDLGNTTAVTGAPTGAVNAAINSAGTVLTLTVTTALTLDAAEGTLALPIAGSAATTMKDINGTAATAAGSNAATVNAINL